ncbi:MAG: hypothetical protein NVS9B1_07490 [Candidatus Dormibacteraceae bacterium]
MSRKSENVGKLIDTQAKGRKTKDVPTDQKAAGDGELDNRINKDGGVKQVLQTQV